MEKPPDKVTDPLDMLGSDIEPNMLKFRTEGEYLRLTEEINALDCLERAYEFIRKVENDILAWKWVVITLHGALYGFAICAARGTNSYTVTVGWKGKRLIDFNKALKICQSPKHMKMTVDSRALKLTRSQKKSIKYLRDVFRNKFEHYIPRDWSIELHGMPEIIIDVLDVIRFLALETNIYVHLTKDQMERVEFLVAESKKILVQSRLYIENQQGV